MFRKMHFNDHMNAEADNGPPFTSFISQRIQPLLARYPLGVFCFMILAILLSGALSFTVLRFKEDPVLATPEASSLLRSRTLGETLRAIGKITELHQQLAEIAGKDSLSRSDSIVMIRILDELKHRDQKDEPTKLDKE